MSNDILKSVSQRSYGAYDEENRRIQEISDELQRLCRLYEEEPRDGKGNGSRFEIEQRAAEQYAKSVGMWIPMDKVFDLGEPGCIPRECTLSILSQFVGYQDWDDFYKKHEKLNDSDFLGETVKVADLTTGSEICLEWNPDRRCLLQKEADGSLIVLEASNCKLQIGDTFNTAWLSVGQPLYATRLIRNGRLLPDYVAGRCDGLTKVMIK